MDEMSFEQAYVPIRELYLKSDPSENLKKLCQKLENKKVVIFGAGLCGEALKERLQSKGITIDCFCDNFKQGKSPVSNTAIIEPERLSEQFPDAIILIAIPKKHDLEETRQQLLKAGYSAEHILAYPEELLSSCDLNRFESEHLKGFRFAYEECFTDTTSREVLINKIRYLLMGKHVEPTGGNLLHLDDARLRYGDNGVFIDGGGYIGDSVLEFCKQCKAHGVSYKHIYTFEPDKRIIQRCKKNLSGISNVTILPYGLWSESGELSFISQDYWVAHEEKTNFELPETLPVISLDDFFQGRKVDDFPTLIKLNIEGAEYEALKGAKYIIEKKHPQIILQTNHKIEDIYVLTKQLLKIDSSYNFHLVQHELLRDVATIYAG